MSEAVRHHHRYTYDEYLAHEQASNVRHEFVDGEIFAMAGGSPQHAALAVAVSASLYQQLRGRPCSVHSSDLKVRVTPTVAVYPDVTVICGPPQHDSLSKDVVLNPTLVVEVTSRSTEDWDRGEKLENYKRVPSLGACVFVSHRTRRLEIVVRGADGSWTWQSAGPGERLALVFIEGVLAVDEIYAGIDLERP